MRHGAVGPAADPDVEEHKNLLRRRCGTSAGISADGGLFLTFSSLSNATLLLLL